MSRLLTVDELPEFIHSLEARGFFGKVILEFSRGDLKIIRLEETRILANHEKGDSHEHQSQRSNVR